MKAVTLKANTEGIFLIFDMNEELLKIEEDLKKTFKEAAAFWGTEKEVFVILENSDQEVEDMKIIENLLQSLGIKVKNHRHDSPGGQHGQTDSYGSIQSEGSTLLLQKNIRSGQKIEHDGTIVVIGDVNPGAEIKAAGHVIIIGNLKGNVFAGYNGDSETVIYANRFEPSIIKIADCIAKAPEGSFSDFPEPELARIIKGRIVIEKI